MFTNRAIIKIKDRVVLKASGQTTDLQEKLIDQYQAQLARCIFVLLGGTTKKIYKALDKKRFPKLAALIAFCDPHFYKAGRSQDIETALIEACTELGPYQTTIGKVLFGAEPLLSDLVGILEDENPERITDDLHLSEAPPPPVEIDYRDSPTSVLPFPPIDDPDDGSSTDSEEYLRSTGPQLEIVQIDARDVITSSNVIYDEQSYLPQDQYENNKLIDLITSHDKTEEEHEDREITPRTIQYGADTVPLATLNTSLDTYQGRSSTMRALLKLSHHVVLISLSGTKEDPDPALLAKKYNGAPVVYRFDRKYFIYFPNALKEQHIEISNWQQIKALDLIHFPPFGQVIIKDRLRDLNALAPLFNENFRISKESVLNAIQTEFWPCNKTRRLNLFRGIGDAKCNGTLTDTKLFVLGNTFQQAYVFETKKRDSITCAELSNEILKYHSKSWFNSDGYRSKTILELRKLTDYSVVVKTVDDDFNFSPHNILKNDELHGKIPVLYKQRDQVYLAIKKEGQIHYVKLENGSLFKSIFPQKNNSGHYLNSLELPKFLIRQINAHQDFIRCLNKKITKAEINQTINQGSFWRRAYQKRIFNEGLPKGDYGADEVMENLYKKFNG